MNKTCAWITVAVIVLTLAFGWYGQKISGAYGEAHKVQLHLDEANGEIEALQKSVKELAETTALDSYRIAELEARVYSK